MTFRRLRSPRAATIASNPEDLLNGGDPIPRLRAIGFSGANVIDGNLSIGGGWRIRPALGTVSQVLRILLEFEASSSAAVRN
jgi:hypothetical protein